MRALAAWIVMTSGTAVAGPVADTAAVEDAATAEDAHGPVPWGVSITAAATADSEVAASGHANVNGWLARGADGGPFITVDLDADLDRIPWLSAPRELSGSPYRAATAGFRLSGAMEGKDAPVFGHADYATFPIEMTAGLLSQGGRLRKFAAGSGKAIDMCWKHADGEPTCVAWFGGRAREVRDDVRAYTAIVIYLAPVTGLRLGPVRVDAFLGGATASRSRLDASAGPPELHVDAVMWDLTVRGRAGNVDLALASKREPYATVDGALSLEDDISANASIGERTRWMATAYAARTRWWTDASAIAGSARTLGAELAFSTHVAGFDLVARGGVGRSFYSSLDATLPRTPDLGARMTVDVKRTFDLH